jgi:hypothetical protein
VDGAVVAGSGRWWSKILGVGPPRCVLPIDASALPCPSDAQDHRGAPPGSGVDQNRRATPLHLVTAAPMASAGWNPKRAPRDGGGAVTNAATPVDCLGVGASWGKTWQDGSGGHARGRFSA